MHQLLARVKITPRRREIFDKTLDKISRDRPTRKIQQLPTIIDVLQQPGEIILHQAPPSQYYSMLYITVESFKKLIKDAYQDSVYLVKPDLLRVLSRVVVTLDNIEDTIRINTFGNNAMDYEVIGYA